MALTVRLFARPCYFVSNLGSLRHRTYSKMPEVSCKKLVIEQFGEPTKVVKIEEEHLSSPKSGEVLIEMLVASMNPADINTIQGTYPIKPELPGVPGQEGVGKVAGIGEGVTGLELGDMVIPNIENFGTWRTHVVTKAGTLLKIPRNVPLVEVAGIASNTSTAYRMLKDFVSLKKGDSVVQNGGNSSAGQNVIQLCKAWGINSISVVRDRPDIDKLKRYLTELGATLVLTEEEFRTTDVFKSGQLPAPRLGLNCVGGKSASELMRKLCQRGVIVTYGGMSREPLIIPTSLLIFKDISAQGYWMTRWTKENRTSEARTAMYEELLSLMVEGKIRAPVHKLIPLDGFREGLEKTANPKGFAGTKYLIDFSSLGNSGNVVPNTFIDEESMGQHISPDSVDL